MSYINTKSNRTFDFYAPYTEEGDRVQRIPFPVAASRKPADTTHITHDCNPQLMAFGSDATAGTFTVDTQVQPGALLIVRNEHATVAQSIGGVSCAAKKVTTLMWDGNAYVSIANSAIAAED